MADWSSRTWSGGWTESVKTWKRLCLAVKSRRSSSRNSSTAWRPGSWKSRVRVPAPRPRLGGRATVGAFDHNGDLALPSVCASRESLGTVESAPVAGGTDSSGPKWFGGTLGRLPERPKGADCKSAGTAYGGSNPSSATAAQTANSPKGSRFVCFKAMSAGHASSIRHTITGSRCETYRGFRRRDPAPEENSRRVSRG